jgi:hypothetical protein
MRSGNRLVIKQTAENNPAISHRQKSCKKKIQFLKLFQKPTACKILIITQDKNLTSTNCGTLKN